MHWQLAILDWQVVKNSFEVAAIKPQTSANSTKGPEWSKIPYSANPGAGLKLTPQLFIVLKREPVIQLKCLTILVA